MGGAGGAGPRLTFSAASLASSCFSATLAPRGFTFSANFMSFAPSSPLPLPPLLLRQPFRRAPVGLPGMEGAVPAEELPRLPSESVSDAGGVIFV